MTGYIFDIQRYSTHDGPGIRSTVFFKGCSMRCIWCHNPESHVSHSEIQVFRQKCIGCGRCIQVCPTGAHQVKGNTKIFNRALCQHCGKCAEECYAEALMLTGKEMSIPDVMEVLERDRAFYENSGGGITCSGGEPLQQVKFMSTLLQSCKATGFHTIVETAGYVGWNSFLSILPYTDVFYYDLKLMDAKQHQQYTGVGNATILENLKRLSTQSVSIRIRIPIIPGITDTSENINAICKFLQPLRGIEGVDLIPFHNMATTKYESLDLEYKVGEFATINENSMRELLPIFHEWDINAICT